ncbi:MAG: hypothetical protein CV082_13750 [Candidatus Brocadia sp. BL1]|nr:MAG: hypothetical protein CV082_13750 [Candidatus Brocadia sp. BL1]
MPPHTEDCNHFRKIIVASFLRKRVTAFTDLAIKRLFMVKGLYTHTDNSQDQKYFLGSSEKFGQPGQNIC